MSVTKCYYCKEMKKGKYVVIDYILDLQLYICFGCDDILKNK